MQVELHRIAPLRAANVLSLLYAVSMLLFAVPMFLMASFMPVAGADPNAAAGLSMFRWLVFLYPVFGLVFGWIFGLVSAFFYNVISGWIGGLHFEYQPGLDGTSTRAA